MKERPILFSAPMVRAILEGRKTQTRRIVKLTEPGEIRRPGGEFLKVGPQGPFWNPYGGAPDQPVPSDVLAKFCPYGVPGARLWVKETFMLGEDVGANGDGPFYRATDPGWDQNNEGHKWRPSLFMPRWASRITLEITEVRVERLHDISVSDAVAEGVLSDDVVLYGGSLTCDQAPFAYSQLWEQINGKGSRDLNPWVWVVTFAPPQGESFAAPSPTVSGDEPRKSPAAERPEGEQETSK